MIKNRFTAKKRQLVLMVIMSVVTLVAISIVIVSLYRSAIENEKAKLVTLLKSQVSLIESVAEFDARNSMNDHPDGARGSTIEQLVNAYSKANDFGKTGEFVLGSLDNGQARFLYKFHERYSERLQEAMRGHNEGVEGNHVSESETVVMVHALHGKTGITSAKDYELIDVLAAYTWIDALKVGLVAKVDVAEIQAPFIRSAWIAFAFCIPAIFAGYFLFMKLSDRFVSELEERQRNLRSASELNQNIFMLSPVGMVLYDMNGDCADANMSAARIIGATREQLLGQNYNDIESWKTSGLLDMAQGVVAENAAQRRELLLDTSFGKLLTIDAHMVIFGNANSKRYLLLVIDDISERIEALAALSRNEETFSRAQEIAHIGSWDWNIVTNELAWSDEIYRIFGLETQQFGATYDAFLEYIHPDDRQAVIEAVNACVGDKDVRYKIEHRVIQPTGVERIVMEQGKVYWNDANQPVRMIGTIHDVTDVRKADEALRVSEERYQLAVKGSSDGLWDWNIVTGADYFSPRWLELLGFSEGDEVPQMVDTFVSRLHPDEQEAVSSAMQDHLERHLPYDIEFRLRKKDDSYGWFLARGQAVWNKEGVPVRMAGSITDISRRKQAEELLKKSEQYNRMLFEQSPVGLALVDMDGELVDVNPAYAKMIGYDVDEVKKLTYWDITPKEYEKDEQKQLESLEKTGRYGPYEKEYIHKDGHRVPVSLSGMILEDKGKKYIWSSVEDITRRKESEKNVAAQARLLDLIFRYTQDRLIILDRHYNFVRVSNAYAESCAREVFELEGKNHFELYPSDLEQEIQPFVRNKEIYNRSARPFSFPDHPEWGVTYWDLALIPILDAKDEIEMFIFTLKDVTKIVNSEAELREHRDNLEGLVGERTRELEQTQDELVRKERLATLGQLTATVSHELRNPLAAMRPSLYFIRKIIDLEDDRLVKAIERIDRNVTRCDHIIDELLDFTRITNMELESVVLEDWLKGVLSEYAIHPDIRLVQTLSLGDYQAQIDVNRLRRAVINVIDNACQAMQEEDNPEQIRPDAQLTIETVMDHGRVEIRTQDTGVGIPEDVLPKIFEPLYSTKSFGVGLGMPIIKQIMEQHGGGVEVAANPGKGTMVTLWLA